MKLRSNKSILLLTFCISLLTIAACGDLLNDSGSSAVFDWKKAPAIAEGNDQLLTEQQKQNYIRDAEIIAVRYVNQRDSTQTDIPDELIDILYNGLVQIATSDLRKARQVSREYRIHALAPDPREIIVYVNANTPWIAGWKKGESTTGNEKADKLIDQFNFSLADYTELNSEILATLRSNHAINGSAVGHLFEEINNVLYAGPDYIIGDGNHIQVLFFDDHLQFNFEYGFGDCPSGCINKHIWKFNVFQNGKVKFIGEQGTLPEI